VTGQAAEAEGQHQLDERGHQGRQRRRQEQRQGALAQDGGHGGHAAVGEDLLDQGRHRRGRQEGRTAAAVARLSATRIGNWKELEIQ
jgi:hypothetical protein